MNFSIHLFDQVILVKREMEMEPPFLHSNMILHKLLQVTLNKSIICFVKEKRVKDQRGYPLKGFEPIQEDARALYFLPGTKAKSFPCATH